MINPKRFRMNQMSFTNPTSLPFFHLRTLGLPYVVRASNVISHQRLSSPGVCLPTEVSLASTHDPLHRNSFTTYSARVIIVTLDPITPSSRQKHHLSALVQSRTAS